MIVKPVRTHLASSVDITKVNLPPHPPFCQVDTLNNRVQPHQKKNSALFGHDASTEEGDYRDATAAALTPCPIPCRMNSESRPDQSSPYRLDRSAFSVGKLSDPSNDVGYWLTRTPEERLARWNTCEGWLMDTMPLPPDFKEFLRLLNSARIEYLVVGGYAVAFHGYPRPTGDLDIWVAVSPANKRAAHRHKDLGDVDELEHRHRPA